MAAHLRGMQFVGKSCLGHVQAVLTWLVCCAAEDVQQLAWTAQWLVCVTTAVLSRLLL